MVDAGAVWASRTCRLTRAGQKSDEGPIPHNGGQSAVSF